MSVPISHEELEEAAQAIERLDTQDPPRGLPAFSRVLVAADGGATSEAALAWARELASDAQVWVVHVAEAAGPEPRALLAKARQTLGLPDERAILAYGDAGSEVAKLADELRAGVVVVGSHGRTMADRILLGSVSDAVRRTVKTSVLIARRPPGAGPIVAAIDGSANSTRAAGVAARLAARRGIELTLLHVLSTSTLHSARTWKGGGHLTEVVVAGDPADRIVAEAKARDASLVVMGARGHGRVRSTVMGSVSTAVCHRAATSVLVVRGPLG